MDGFSQLTNWFMKAWAESTIVGRIMTLLAGALLVATIAGAAVWSSMPDYKLLREGIAPAETAEIVSALNTVGIPNQMNYSGTGVMVPASRWNEANITISSLSIGNSESATPKPSGSIFPTRPGHDDAVRGKELALKRSLESMRGIKSADVHLAIPERSPFRKNQQQPSASVIIEPVANQSISQEKALSMVNMVASAVEGLDPKNVSLTDADGRLIGNVANGDPAALRRDYIADLEARLVLKAEDLLLTKLGPNRAVVRVTAEVDDFLDKVTTRNQIIAADKVRLIEKTTSADNKGLSVGAGGVAGTSSNEASNLLATDGGEQQLSGKAETTETTYDYPRTEETVREIGGVVQRLSVSALVDSTPQTNPDGTPAGTPPTQEEIERLIKGAIGFDASRGDQLEVVLSQFSAAPSLLPELEVPSTQKWEFMSQLARNASLGMAAIVALLVGSMTLKKLKPIQVKGGANDSQRREILSTLANRVDDNPEAVSKILAAWIGQEPDEEAPATVPMNKAA